MTRAAVLVAVALCVFAAGAVRAGEMYGNFTTMGVVVDCPSGVKSEDVARVRMYLLDEGARVPMHDLVRVGSENYFAGSLFWLEPDREYAAEVTFQDKDGKALARREGRGAHARGTGSAEDERCAVRITVRRRRQSGDAREAFADRGGGRGEARARRDALSARGAVLRRGHGPLEAWYEGRADCHTRI